jgi:sugar phosphate isomerase/epimerase
MSEEEGMQHATEVFRQVLPVLEKREVTLALEPLGETTTNFMKYARDTVALVDRVDSPWCRLILDCKAMVGETEPIPALIRKYRKQLAHFHANDANRRGPGMGDLDFHPIMAALQDIGFDGWVSVEVFDLSPGAEALARESIDYLRKITAQLAG